MLLEYQELDIVGKNSSVKQTAELRPEKHSFYERDILVVDLNIFFHDFEGDH